jgi:hypothetical protein
MKLGYLTSTIPTATGGLMQPFNVAQIAVTHTYYYEPSDYLEYCQENNIIPTEAGFYNFILPEIDEDFPNSQHHPYSVTYTES